MGHDAALGINKYGAISSIQSVVASYVGCLFGVGMELACAVESVATDYLVDLSLGIVEIDGNKFKRSVGMTLHPCGIYIGVAPGDGIVRRPEVQQDIVAAQFVERHAPVGVFDTDSRSRAPWSRTEIGTGIISGTDSYTDQDCQ